MTDHNRGAYTPQSEAPLAFDARRSSGDRPFPTALLVSAGILAIIVVALVVFLMRQPDGSDPAADSGEVIDAMKIEPVTPLPSDAPPPGMQVAVEDPLAAPSFTPPPEQPAARPEPIAAAPAPAPAPKAAPKAAAPADPLAAVMPKSAPAPTSPAPAPKAPAPKTPAASGGGPQVQIGAFSSPALAEKGWNDIAGMFPGQMAGKTKRVEQVESDGSTLHRAFIGGFANRADAEAFCDSLKARGRACLVR